MLSCHAVRNCWIKLSCTPNNPRLPILLVTLLIPLPHNLCHRNKVVSSVTLPPDTAMHAKCRNSAYGNVPAVVASAVMWHASHMGLITAVNSFEQHVGGNMLLPHPCVVSITDMYTTGRHTHGGGVPVNLRITLS